MPEHSLSAGQLVAHLDGALTVAFATVTARGEPRVSPIGAFFLRGSFYIPTVAEARRARHVARRPAASLTYFEGEDLAVIVHGQASVIDVNDAGFAELDATQVACGAISATKWGGTGAYLHLEAKSLFTFAREPERYDVARSGATA